MISRREFLQLAAATAAVLPGGWRARVRAAAAHASRAPALRAAVGNVTLVHLTDLHAQLMPVLFREPSVNLGVGEARGDVAAYHRPRVARCITRFPPAARRPMR